MKIRAGLFYYKNIYIMKKGINIVIATILLSTIGLIASISIYYWTTPTIRETISEQESMIKKEFYTLGTKVRVDQVDNCKLYLRNIGGNDLSLDWITFYIDNIPVKWDSSGDILEKDKVVEINLKTDSPLEGDLSIKLRDKTIDLGKIFCYPPPSYPIPSICSIKTICNATENCIFSLSNLTNAHVGNCSAYKYKLCCSDIKASYTSGSCTSGVGVLSLSANTNAQAQLYNHPTGFVVKNNICLNSSKGTLECINNTKAWCVSQNYIPLFSISSDSNAHIGDYNSYDKVLCCRIN